MAISRRALTAGLAASAIAREARAEGDSPLDLTTLHLEHELVLAIPRAQTAPVPLVVLLHGLAETSDEHTGARAWVDRYGLASSVGRLLHAPLAPIAKRDDWGSTLATTNAALAARPYRGLAFVCPYVPRMASAALGAYARWLLGTAIPRVRSEAGARVDAAPPRIAGCSYGGWVSLELFLQPSSGFSAWAGIQTAISRDAVPSYADRLSRVPVPRPLYLETSTLDPFHDATLALAAALDARHVPCDRLVLPGPHDQPWLREAGTPCALAWLDRV